MDGGLVSIMQLTSLPIIIGAAIFLTWVAKRALASVPMASQVPVWVYTGLIAAVLTYIANRVTGTLPGNTGTLIVDAIINGALASGLREWWTTGSRPLADSGTAVKAREGTGDGFVRPKGNMDSWILPLLLAGSLASGCALGRATVDPTPDTTTVEQVRTEAAKLAAATKEAATLAVESRRIVQAGYEAGLVPADVLRTVNDAAIVTRDKGLAFITFAETVTTDPSLRVTAAELLKVFDGYLEALAGAGQSGAAIRTALAVLRAYLGGA